MKEKDNVKSIQILDDNGKVIYECTRGFSFPVKNINKQMVDNILIIKGRNIPLLHSGKQADIIVHTKSGKRVKYFCRVNVSTANQLNLTLDVERAKALTERRRYYRIKTALNCRVVDITRGEEVFAFSPNLYGKIYDINIGGIFVVVDHEQPFLSGDMMSFVSVLGKKRLEASARILRTSPPDSGIGEGVNGYKCAFVAISSQQEEMISSYINHLQLEERRIELETEKLAGI